MRGCRIYLSTRGKSSSGNSSSTETKGLRDFQHYELLFEDSICCFGLLRQDLDIQQQSYQPLVKPSRLHACKLGNQLIFIRNQHVTCIPQPSYYGCQHMYKTPICGVSRRSLPSQSHLCIWERRPGSMRDA
jgi:hypothetical protein